jgi:exopolyphosphatase/guanosine-5'-triphosphate,3'-diphosphate pyrophosphatase
LHQLFGFISRMASADLAGLDGVSPGRAHQLVAGALVADAAMRALKVTELHICPWALREGAILHRLDTLGVPTPSPRPWPLTDRRPATRHQPRTATLLNPPTPSQR